MKQINHRDYDKLSPIERFQLTLKALARDDEEEAERLKRTCPRKHYSELDAAYSDRFESLERIIAAFLMQMECIRGKKIMMEVIKELVMHFGKAVQVVLRLNANPNGLSEAESKEIPDHHEVLLTAIERLYSEQVEEMEEIIQGELKGQLEMFEEVCLEMMGLSSETILKGLGASKALPWIDFERLEKVKPLKPDPEIKEAFIGCWERNL